MKYLNIIKPCGDHYKVDPEGNIIRMDIEGFVPSDEWKFIGISHVTTHHCFIPFADLTEEKLKSLTLLYKNNNPQWTGEDNDHGVRRIWGNTKYHGIKSLYWTEE